MGICGKMFVAVNNIAVDAKWQIASILSELLVNFSDLITC